MFGYIRTDTPYLYIKDDTLYRAMYCGVCKGIAASCGQCARMGLTYDVTFLSVVLHNIAGIDVTIEKQHCVSHVFRRRPMAVVDELTEKLGALNTVLAYYKYSDDVEDGDGGRGKRLWFAAGRKRATKRYPEIEEIVRRNMRDQRETEKSGTDSLDRAADATASMMAQLSDYFLGDKRTSATFNLFYAVGKWIYLIDALDDYDKDRKKGAYNPFLAAFGRESRRELMRRDKKEIEFAFHSLFFDIRESLSKIVFHFNRDLSDNILLRGLPAETSRVMYGSGGSPSSLRSHRKTDVIGKTFAADPLKESVKEAVKEVKEAAQNASDALEDAASALNGTGETKAAGTAGAANLPIGKDKE